MHQGQSGEIIGITLAVIAGLFLLIFLFKAVTGFRIIERGTATVVERWGKFHKVLEPGFHYIIPFWETERAVIWRDTDTLLGNGGVILQSRVIEEKLKKIDLRDDTMDFESQSVITRDNVEILVHPMMLYRVNDPIRLCYETSDPVHCVEKLVQTTLRSIIGDMGLDDTLASREEINAKLTNKIKHICSDWGIEIHKVELLEIVPSQLLHESMLKQLSAERLRRAAIIYADGIREQQKTEAEGNAAAVIALSKGEQQVNILNAQASYESKVIIAEAESEAVKIISAAMKSIGKSADPTKFMVATKYLSMMESVCASANRRLIYFPMEMEIMGSLAKIRTADSLSITKDSKTPQKSANLIGL